MIPPLPCFIVFQYAPTNKLLYAKDIPKFKQEVKAYYKQVRDQPSFTASEFKDFLKEESQVRCMSGQNQKESGRWRRRSERRCACCHFRNMKTSSTKPQPSERFTNSSNSISQRSVVLSIATQSFQALPALCFEMFRDDVKVSRCLIWILWLGNCKYQHFTPCLTCLCWVFAADTRHCVVAIIFLLAFRFPFAFFRSH